MNGQTSSDGAPPLALISIGAKSHRASARAMYETSGRTKYESRAEALYKKTPIDIGASKEKFIKFSSKIRRLFHQYQK